MAHQIDKLILLPILLSNKYKKISGEKPFNLEGKSLADWILLDYVNVVVHVFSRGNSIPLRFGRSMG